jgi:hypothetical protein
MTEHPRTHRVAMAKFDIERAVLEIVDREGLTFIELVQALTATIDRASKYALRRERHPEHPDKPADEA